MFGGVYDSDQSISEEEDEDVERSEHCAISLGSPSENKGRSIGVLSQIETLERAYGDLDGPTISTSSFQERQPGFCIEDEIEFPLFNKNDDAVHLPRVPPMIDSACGIICSSALPSTCNSGVDGVCQEDKASPCLRHEKNTSRDEWLEANKEVGALIQFEKTGFSLTSSSCSKLSKSFKGVQSKVKARFSFQSGSFDGGHFHAKSDTSGLYPADVLKTEAFSPGDSRSEFLEELDGTEVEQLEENQIAVCGDRREYSVAELLDSLQGQSSLLLGNSETNRQRGRRKVALTVDKIADDKDMDEDMLMDVWSSPSEEEDNSTNPQSVHRRTMVDHIQEVFDAVSPKYQMPNAMSGNALFERLQNVLLVQKEADADFLKKSQAETNLMEEIGCLDVKLLSRSLESKLTVCCCSLVSGEAKFHTLNWNGEKILTVIFSSRTCNGVELEVGNLVRVHPPWKEVNTRRQDEAVILSSYFSQM